MHTDFVLDVLDALEQALYARQPALGTLTHHNDRGSQYVSIRYTERLAEAGIEPSVGSRGDKLRQRAGRNDQWVIQSRINSQTRTLEKQGIR
jgi:transposase InsO family protein